jgi:glutamine---fructose-6-phosphate transaminase (isomerizing)
MNAYERTDFKSGFAGVPPKAGAGKHYHLSAASKASIALFYGGQYLLNPGYINNSVSDTVFAYMSYYFTNQDYLYLFDYLEWNEGEVEDVLLGQYDFERPVDTRTTWRIGDGTAPFYNYVYHTVAGFTEFDTFRSNQIREGVMSRETALVRVEEENQPRWNSIKEYLGLVNVDFDDAIKAINRIPKLYDR